MIDQQIRQSDRKVTHQSSWDVIILGAGAAGLMCAAVAGRRGKRVLLLEASNKAGKKILMSGGGRCNFTNLHVAADNFICDNPHFVKSALQQYSQQDFISLVESYQIKFHEKSQGQLFCDDSARQILQMLVEQCDQVGVHIMLDQKDIEVKVLDGRYQLLSNEVVFSSDALVVATGGLSIPTLGGATGLGYQLAQQFGLTVNATEASLVPFTLSGRWQDFASALSGVALPVEVSVPAKSFNENMLFTHRGLSGPAILQLSNYWHLGQAISINLLPDQDVVQALQHAKRDSPAATLLSWLSARMPTAVARALHQQWWPERTAHALHQWKNRELLAVAEQLATWQLTPSGTEGYRTAEVTRGGVDVAQISSKTMQVKNQPGLFFIGEVLDVTGHLGGHNFQWAWSSGFVAGRHV